MATHCTIVVSFLAHYEHYTVCYLICPTWQYLVMALATPLPSTILQSEPMSDMLFEANLETASNSCTLLNINGEVMMN